MGGVACVGPSGQPRDHCRRGNSCSQDAAALWLLVERHMRSSSLPLCHAFSMNEVTRGAVAVRLCGDAEYSLRGCALGWQVVGR